jgi:hypothetical protein
LFLPDEIHEAGWQFLAPLIVERLPALDEIKGGRLGFWRQFSDRVDGDEKILLDEGSSR